LIIKIYIRERLGMIWSTYKVTLKGWTTVIRAFNEREAIILAQAEAINEGRAYDLIGIDNVTPCYGVMR